MMVISALLFFLILTVVQLCLRVGWQEPRGSNVLCAPILLILKVRYVLARLDLHPPFIDYSRNTYL